RGLQHLDAVLVRAREKEDIAAVEPHKSRDSVSGDRLIGVPDMRRTVRISDRGGDVIRLANRLLTHEGWLSTARGLGKQAENIEDQRLALKIVGLGIARCRIDVFGCLGEAVKACQVTAATVKPLREPAIDGVEKRRQRLRIGSGQGVAERMQID